MAEAEQIEPADRELARPWGFWATIGFTVIVMAASFVVGLLVLVAFAAYERVVRPDTDILVYVTSLQTNGDFLGTSAIVTAMIGTPMCLLFAGLRRGISLTEYMGLGNVPVRTTVFWIGILIPWIATLDVLTYLCDRPIVPDFMIDAYSSSAFLPLLFLGVIVAAPLFEEFVFRGLLFEGIRHSRLGSLWAVGLTSLGWGLLHIQYDAFQIGTIVGTGFLLGFARIKSKSIAVPFAMHAFMNLVATLETAVFLKFFA